jgi:PIN domain nuclease of toxin-antitoxin system
MKVLLDIHTLLWALLNPARLSKRVRSILEDPGSRVFVASISFLEISIKYRLGKLSLSGGDPRTLLSEARAIGFECLPMDCFTAAGLHERDLLPGDPFDRMLCHLAVEQDLIVVSKDDFFKKAAHTGVKRIW